MSLRPAPVVVWLYLGFSPPGLSIIFGRACTYRKYFDPAALGGVHQ